MIVRIVRGPHGMLTELFEDTVQFLGSALGVSFCSKTERRPRPTTNTGRLCAKYIVITPCITSTA